ncbi:MAG TPA: hypothetical protein VH599_14655 [Ktedonobacterales bacterium]|jgi:hypothetical protein
MRQLADSPAPAEIRLHGRWLLIARVAWLSVAIVSITSFFLTLPFTFADLEQVCTSAACDFRLRPQDLPVLAEWGLSPAAFAAYGTTLNGLAYLAWIAMGVLLFARGSAEPRALFFSFCLLVSGGGPSPDLAMVQPIWRLPVAAWLFLASICLYLLLLLFPNGQFVPRWARWVALAWIVLNVPVSFFPDLPLRPDTWPGAAFTLGFFGYPIAAQVYRYARRSTPLERQQTKWVLLVLGLFLLLLLGGGPVVTGKATALWVVLVLGTALQVAILLIPLAIAASILRYRLWEVDSLINKALVYGLLTGILGALYAGLIIGLEHLLGLFGGTAAQNPIVLVVSTLAIFALSLPLRRRIQRLIDRRFYRKKYNAEQTLAAFSASLRNEVDLEQVRANLLAVVQETMQPAHVSLWLRQPAWRTAEALPPAETLE